MKIALVYFNLTAQIGGQRQFLSLARELKNIGETVVIYAAEFDPRCYADLTAGLDIRTVPLSKKFSDVVYGADSGFFARLQKKWQIERLYREAAQKIAAAMDPDFPAVNCHEDFAYKVGFFYKKTNPLAHIVWTMNNPPYMRFKKENLPFDLLNRIYVFYKDITEKKFLRAIDRVTVLSVYEEAWAKKRGLPVEIVWSGLDFERFYAHVKQRNRSKRMRILSVGVLNQFRRYEDLIEAIAELRKEGYDATATLVCKDIWGEKDYRQRTIALAKDLGVDRHVRFLFGGATEDILKKIYRESDVFVMTTHIPPPQGYGWGLAVFEAIAAGLPVVICNTSGAAHVLRDKENALLVNPHSPREVALAIKHLAGDPDFYRDIAEQAQTFVKEHISWKKYAENILRLLKEPAK